MLLADAWFDNVKLWMLNFEHWILCNIFFSEYFIKKINVSKLISTFNIKADRPRTLKPNWSGTRNDKICKYLDFNTCYSGKYSGGSSKNSASKTSKHKEVHVSNEDSINAANQEFLKLLNMV